MKTYLYSLLILTCLLSACVEKKERKSGDSDSSVADKENGIGRTFAANEVEDLGTSSSMKDILCQNWEYYEDAKDARYAEPSNNIDIVYRGYSIFGDGTVIKDPRGTIRAGRWRLDEKVKPITIRFELDNGEVENYELAYLIPFEMKLAKNVTGNKEIIDLRAEAIRYLNYKDAPFYLSNNLWRFKPIKSEPEEQLKARLKACIHFFILFYDHQIKADAKEVLFTGLPSCFKWYGGAIYLQKEKELDQKWISTFYSREDAMKAYKLADKLMSIKFNWPKKESNWLKLNVAVLRQMEAKIDGL